jgi:hypothetical protein
MLKKLLYFIALLLLFFAFSEFLSVLETVFRWQTKAIAIYNILGGTLEPWWSESPVKIAVGLSLADIWTLAKIVGASFSWAIGRIVK